MHTRRNYTVKDVWDEATTALLIALIIILGGLLCFSWIHS